MDSAQTPGERWDRTAADLRAFRDARQRAWGDLDDVALARYLAGEGSAEERSAVERAVAERPQVREAFEILQEVLGPAVQPEAAPEPSPVVVRLGEVRRSLAERAARWGQRWLMPATAAAALVLGLGVGWWVYLATRGAPGDAGRVAVVTPPEVPGARPQQDPPPGPPPADPPHPRVRGEPPRGTPPSPGSKALSSPAPTALVVKAKDDEPRLREQARFFWEQGRVAEAEPLLREALDARRQARAPEGPETAAAYNNLAASLDAQGKHAEAAPLYETALAIYRRAPGEHSLEVAACLNNQAANLDVQGKHKAAAPLYEQALAINQKALGEQNPDTVPTLSNLATNQLARGNMREAARLLHQAVKLQQSAGAAAAQAYGNPVPLAFGSNQPDARPAAANKPPPLITVWPPSLQGRLAVQTVPPPADTANRPPDGK